MSEVDESALPASATFLPDKLKPLAAEIATYQRELPQLLQDGQAGRFAVIQGNLLYGTWDTYRDASQYARERFALDQSFMVQRIDARDPARISRSACLGIKS